MSLAFLKYLALSDPINLGVPLLAVNLLKARKNVTHQLLQFGEKFFL